MRWQSTLLSVLELQLQLLVSSIDSSLPFRRLQTRLHFSYNYSVSAFRRSLKRRNVEQYTSDADDKCINPANVDTNADITVSPTTKSEDNVVDPTLKALQASILNLP